MEMGVTSIAFLRDTKIFLHFRYAFFVELQLIALFAGMSNPRSLVRRL